MDKHQIVSLFVLEELLCFILKLELSSVFMNPEVGEVAALLTLLRLLLLPLTNIKLLCKIVKLLAYMSFQVRLGCKCID